MGNFLMYCPHQPHCGTPAPLGAFKSPRYSTGNVPTFVLTCIHPSTFLYPSPCTCLYPSLYLPLVAYTYPCTCLYPPVLAYTLPHTCLYLSIPAPVLAYTLPVLAYTHCYTC